MPDPGAAFEEVLSRRLASLHAFAMFLACDRQEVAEDLLTSAVSHAFEVCLGGADPSTALEQSLLAEASELSRPSEPSRQASHRPVVTSLDRVRLGSVSPSCLRRAAARIPLAARTAIWLVVVERRTYADAANVLGIDKSKVAELLAWRDPLIRFALDDAAGDSLRVGGFKH